MNHDELLAKIDEIEHDAWESNKLFFKRTSYNALRAVVGLTKTKSGFEDSDQFEAGWEYAMHLVIQAIEEQLI